jgi:peptide/nickel transport system permease protein
MAGKRGVLTWLAIGWIVTLVALALLAPILPLRDPEALGIRTAEVARFEGPGANAWFGGDEQGKDLLANVIWGARPALLLALLVSGVSALLGAMLGIAAAYFKGRVDGAIMFMVDVLLAFPALIMLVAITGTLGNSLWVLAIALIIVSIPAYTRIIRGATFSIVERDFIEAARSLGATRLRVVTHEIVPNIVLPLASFAFLGFALVIATEGALAFVDLSIDQTTWGSLISEGSRNLDEATHLALIPSTALFLTILSFNFIGESLRGSSGRHTRPPTTPNPPDPFVDGPPAAAESDAVLSIRSLTTVIPTEAGEVSAVVDVSLDLIRGRSRGLVGESGSGKTMLIRSILGTFPVPGVARRGVIEVDAVDLLTADDSTRRAMLGSSIGVVSQNPLTALNPVRTIGTQLAEPMRVHGGLSKAAARARAVDLLGEVGIPEPTRRLAQYPHELSGGMRQRITIAIAIANEPKLLLADEPTTALDVTVQHDILALLARLAQDHRMGLLLVTHDQAVVRDWTDDVSVMYAGQLIEQGTTAAVLENPRHRYTRALLESVPRVGLAPHTRLASIKGQPPLLLDPPTGCRFAARCQFADPDCTESGVAMTDADRSHQFRCHHPGEGPISLPVGSADGR